MLFVIKTIYIRSTNLTGESRHITDASTPFTVAVTEVGDSIRVVEADAAVQTVLASRLEFFTWSRLNRLKDKHGKADEP